MFEKKELIGLDGNPYTKCFYEFNEEDTIVGIIYGHFSPFTGPNGHGRLIEALKKIGAEKFLIVTPQKSTYDADRDMYDINQRVAIAQKFLDEYGYEGKAIPWKIRRGGLKSQLGPILNEAVEVFGLNIRPVYCFGPDRAEVASEVCNEFGNIKMPNRVEYIVDMERGTSGTRVRELIRQNNIEEICNETGYSPKMAKYLVSLCKDKLEEAIRGKVELDFANIYDANEFKQEMEDRFENDKSIHISSNFRLPNYKEGKDMDFEKIYEGIFNNGYDYKYSKADRDYVQAVSRLNINGERISMKFLDIIGVSDELKNKFKKFEATYGKMPMFSYNTQLSRKIEFQKTINRRNVADYFTQEDIDEIKNKWIETYKQTKEEDNIYNGSVESIVDKVVDFIKDNKLGVGCAVFGIAALAGVIPAIAQRYKNNQDIRDAVEYYMSQVEWDSNDKDNIELKSRTTFDAKGNPQYSVYPVTYYGNKSTTENILEKVAKFAKKNGITVRDAFHELDGKKVKGFGGKETDEDAFRFDILKDNNGVLTINVWNEAGKKPKTFEIDTNSYQRIGNVQYSWNESKNMDFERIYNESKE